MKISLQGPAQAFTSGQSVRGEVVGHQNGQSLAVINGIMTRIPRRLPIGHTFSGRVQQGENGETVVESQTPDRQNRSASTQISHPQVKLDATPENRQLTELMKQFGVPVTAETLEEIRHRLPQGSSLTDSPKLRAILLMLARKLPEQHLKSLESYFSGRQRLSDVFARLDGEALSQTRREWGLGRSFAKLLELLEKGHVADSDRSNAVTDQLSENLLFQTLFDVSPTHDGERQIYFQWPLFWQGRDIPDTIEGECFFSRKDSVHRGFSVRVLVHPPNLGDMEIGIHEFEKALWVHFGVSGQAARDALPTSFESMRETLLGQSWKSVKLTIGTKSPRPGLLDPLRPVVPEVERQEVDVKA